MREILLSPKKEDLIASNAWKDDKGIRP